MRAVAVAVAFLAVAFLAVAAHASGDTPPAGLDDCDARVLRDPDRIDSYTCYGRVAQGPAQRAEAIRRLEAHLAFDADNHRARLALAYLDRVQGGDRAEALYREAVEGLARGGPTAEEANGRVFLANLLAQEGRPAEAAAELARAAAAAERLDDDRVVAFVALERARALNRTSDWRAAERILRDVEPRLPDGDARARAAWAAVLGTSYWGQRRPQEALDVFREQVELLASIGADHEEAAARYNVLLLRSQTAPTRDDGERERLHADWADLLRLAERTGNAGIASSAHEHLADLGRRLGRPVAERRAHLRRALELAQRVSERLYAQRALGESLVLDEPRDEARGFELLHAAIEEARASGRPSEETRSATRLAHVYREQARAAGWAPGPLRDRAIEAAEAALDRVEALRHRQPEHLAQARVFARWTFAYDDLAAGLLQDAGGEPLRAGVLEDNLAVATRVLERKRAQVLLDELDAARVPVFPDAPEAAERAEVLARLGAVQRALIEGPPDGARAGLLRELETLEEREAALRLRLASLDRRPDLSQARALPDLEAIRAALRPDEAILSFLSSRSGLRDDFAPSWVLAHTREGTRAYRTPPEEVVEPAIALLLGLVENRDGAERAGAERLHADLVANALAGLPPGVERLIVVPDGPLHRLPFSILRAGPAEEPLGARYRLSVVPSIATWLRWRRDDDASGGRVLALADPALAPAATPAALRAGEDPLDAARRLGPLPHARRETRALDARVAGVRALLGADASESALKRMASGPIALLHVGAHAVVDDARPERSAILLAPGDPAEDGLLQAREIVDLHPGPRVVVLSACRSATGEVLDGEGPMSLARPFFVAGARAVLGSLWPLRDDEAAAFFAGFYRHLARGVALDEALAATRRDRLAAGDPPAAWAGVVLLGDGAAVPFPEGASGPGPPGGGAPWRGAAIGGGVAAATAALVAALAALLLVGRRRPDRGG